MLHEPRPATYLVASLEDRVRSLEDWRLETRTTNRILGRILTGLFGVSVIGLIANIVTIAVVLVAHP